jgi:hypothetical protein
LECLQIVILRISVTVVVSKRKCKTFCFKVKVGEYIRSEIDREWFEGMEGSLGVHKKVGIVGIHGEDQMGSQEFQCGI